MTSRCSPAAIHAPPRNLKRSGRARCVSTDRSAIPNALHMAMLEHVRQRADEFDFLHFHLDYYPFSLFARQATPFVTTLHGRLDLPEHQPVFDTFSLRAGGVDLEFAAAAAAAGALDQDDPSRPAGEAADPAARQAVLFRVPRPHRAGEARRSRHPHRRALRHAAQDRRQGRSRRPRLLRGRDQARCSIRPTSSTSARSAISEKSAFLSGAIALLVPIDWPEPFGLVMIEAMACGTPVIAFNRGSVPEIIEDGVTGFIVEDEAGAIGAVDRLAHLSRRNDPRALRAALHGAAHGARLSCGLSQPDGSRSAAAALVSVTKPTPLSEAAPTRVGRQFAPVERAAPG